MIKSSLQQRIVKLHNQVIKPLLFEIKVSEQLNLRLRAEYDNCAKEVKMLNTTLRIPTMSQEF